MAQHPRAITRESLIEHRRIARSRFIDAINQLLGTLLPSAVRRRTTHNTQPTTHSARFPPRFVAPQARAKPKRGLIARTRFDSVCAPRTLSDARIALRKSTGFMMRFCCWSSCRNKNRFPLRKGVRTPVPLGVRAGSNVQLFAVCCKLFCGPNMRVPGARSAMLRDPWRVRLSGPLHSHSSRGPDAAAKPDSPGLRPGTPANRSMEQPIEGPESA